MPMLRGRPAFQVGCPAQGFILPWTLLMLLIVSTMAASGFLLAWFAGQSARSFARAAEALQIAEGGLEAALAMAEGPAPSIAPVALGSGTATIAFERLVRLNPHEQIFRVISTGRVEAGDFTYERAAGRLMWVADPPTVPAALVLFGSSGTTTVRGAISGLDALGGRCPQQPSPVAGVAWRGSAPPLDPALNLQGLPLLRRIADEVSVASETGIRWTELLASFGPEPDVAVRPDALPAIWPGPGEAGEAPFVRIDGSVTLGAGLGGGGALVVDGDLTLETGFGWTGLILVGGALRLTGDVTVRGALMTGLAGGAAPANFGLHAIDVRFDACAVAAAAQRLTPAAAAVPGTWFEVW